MVAIRTILMMLAGLSVVYVCMFFYLRAGTRMRLEEDWAKSGRPGDMDEWVREREGPAVHRIRIALVVGCYAVPILGLFLWVWLSN